MGSLAALWPWLVAHRERLGLMAGLAVALGVVLIVGGQVAGVDWTRIFGAVLIAAGGTGLGAAVDFSPPLRKAIGQRLMAFRVALIIGLAALITAPILVALVSGIVGPLVHDQDRGDATLSVAGAIIALVFAAATVCTVVIAVRAALRAGRDTPVATDMVDAREGRGQS